MIWDCIIVGGGCAGLSAATKLAEGGLRVLVLESRPLLGGRASSWRDRESGEMVDNGQHLFLGCYEETQRFLRRIGSDHHLKFWNSFSTPMLGPDGQRAHLKTWNLPAPWHLAMGLLGFRALRLSERLGTFRVAAALKGRGNGFAKKSVASWLTELKQGSRSRARLWDLLTLATLNISPDEAPAELLATVLKNGFLASREASRIGLSSVGLSQLHGDPSRDFLEERGSEVRMGSRVRSIRTASTGTLEVSLSGNQREEGRNVIVAVPPPALRKMFEGSEMQSYVEATRKLKASPIVSIHTWFDHIPFAEPMVGFWDQSVHWAFRKDLISRNSSSKHVSLVTSSASAMLERSKRELKELAETELRMSLSQPGLSISKMVVVREREATWIPPLDDRQSRLPTHTPGKGIYLAGDWTDTGLPATIEGAVKSGHQAAHAVVQDQSSLTAR